MKRDRQQKILEIISGKKIATQEVLAAELKRRGIEATQSSVSRDITQLKLTKINGYYSVDRGSAAKTGPILDIDTAGNNLIVVKTEVGLAQPAALTIDRAKLDEIVGTLAGDDTILVAVKNEAAQRLAINKLNRLFDQKPVRSARPNRRWTASRTQ